MIKELQCIFWSYPPVCLAEVNLRLEDVWKSAALLISKYKSESLDSVDGFYFSFN